MIVYAQKSVLFHQDFQTPRSGLRKQGAAEIFWTDFEPFEYAPDETLFQVFDIAFQTDH